ncbi:MAG TPA: terminase small subunit [Psychromonas sp.]
MELWEVAKKSVGKPPKFESPAQMLDRAYQYFQWCKDNPIHVQKPFSSQGEIIYGDEFKMRAMTQDGLCVFLNIGVSTWHDYKNKPKYSEVTKHIESVMKEQKFTGAAGGVLNANIIARDLGLRDASEIEHSGKVSHDVKQITHEMDPQEATRIYQDMINGKS